MSTYAITLILLLQSSIVLAFDATDVKTEEELFVMNERDLAHEAARGCAGYHGELMSIRAGVIPPSLATPYLTRIGMVLMQQGKLPLPDWYTATQLATLGKDIKACYTPSIRLAEQAEMENRQKLHAVQDELHRRMPNYTPVPDTE